MSEHSKEMKLYCAFTVPFLHVACYGVTKTVNIYDALLVNLWTMVESRYADERSYPGNGFTLLSSLIVRPLQHQVKLERREKWPRRIIRPLPILGPAKQRHPMRGDSANYSRRYDLTLMMRSWRSTEEHSTGKNLLWRFICKPTANMPRTAINGRQPTSKTLMQILFIISGRGANRKLFSPTWTVFAPFALHNHVCIRPNIILGSENNITGSFASSFEYLHVCLFFVFIVIVKSKFLKRRWKLSAWHQCLHRRYVMSEGLSGDIKCRSESDC